MFYGLQLWTRDSVRRATQLFGVMVAMVIAAATHAAAQTAAEPLPSPEQWRQSYFTPRLETGDATSPQLQEPAAASEAGAAPPVGGVVHQDQTDPAKQAKPESAKSDENKDEKGDEKKADEKKDEEKKEEEKPKEWYEKYRIRGYAQFRVNEILGEEGAEAQLVGDSSVGENQGFLIRRARLILQGDVTDRISIYLQPDFAATPNGAVDLIQFVQIRDWYADIFLDDDKVNRLRAGQSKVPYGWENLQSSQNRLPLDRNDAFNSATRNERDLGIFYYWTPKYAQDLFKYVVDEGLKGSGNYGVIGAGFYNGQGGSLREQNDNLHFVTRLAVPKKFDNGQIIEWGFQGYTGMYTVLGSPISPLGVGAPVRPDGTLESGNTRGIVDKRLGVTWVYYPQPWGFQAEWTVGRGPGLNETQTEVVDRPLYGGYAMTMYRYQTECYGEFFPFLRYQYYKGGYKSERNAPFVDIGEWELGLEWQFNKNLELTTMYSLVDRTNTRAISTANELSYQQFEGDLLRFQLQVNY